MKYLAAFAVTVAVVMYLLRPRSHRLPVDPDNGYLEVSWDDPWCVSVWERGR